MKKYCLLFVFALAALGVLAKPEGPVQDRDYRSESELPRLEALSFDVDGSAIYGQILVPSSRFGSDRPCVIILHGFAGFTRWDDVAQDLCAEGVVVIIPHHRGAWGSEGEYSVSGCVRDAEALAKWAAGPDFSEKYGTDTNAVFLSGHSMGGNSAVNAAKRCPFVRGLVLIAPCDIGFMASEMTKEEMLKFLNNEGLQVLKHKSDEAVVDDIYANAEDMRFTQAAKALENKSVFLATGEYDKVVPAAPLEEFWKALPRTGARRLKKCYRTTHSLMGARRQLAEDIFTFIKNDTRKKDKKMKDTVYQFSVKTRDGKEKKLLDYKGKVLLIVNTATRCGFTPQYEGLEAMYERLKGSGFELLDFPCNQFGQQAPGSDEEIHSFCVLNYKTAFPQFAKVDVNGESAAPLFKFLTQGAAFEGFPQDGKLAPILEKMLGEADPDYAKKPDIKWNFTKFLIGKDGRIAKRFEPTAPLEEVEKAVKAEINKE